MQIVDNFLLNLATTADIELKFKYPNTLQLHFVIFRKVNALGP